MDDKDGVMIGLIAMQTFVQIPLWTIRTKQAPIVPVKDDFVQIPLWTIRTMNKAKKESGE